MKLRLFRRRSRALDLRPVSELHDKFMQEHPDAEKLLAEADAYLEQREQKWMALGDDERQRLREETDLYLDELVEKAGEPSPEHVANAEALVEGLTQAEPRAPGSG